jgi:hypothetical protein
MSKLFLPTAFLISSLFAFGQKDSLGFSNISIDKFGNVNWTVIYCQNNHGYEMIIEQLKDGKWIKKGDWGVSWAQAVEDEIKSFDVPVGAVGGRSASEIERSEGSTKVKFHKGTNRYRLRMIYPNQFTSGEFQLISSVSNDDGSLWIMDNVIYLDNVEQYEILDKVGATIKKNEASTIDISSLPEGSYFLYTKKATTPFTR